MKWTGLNELRSRFLKFYESKGHVILKSSPLVPQDDNSLLLINSGMAPLKKYFTGVDKIDGNKATSCQKCIRTPDIDNVGKTSRHGTYFEMLGNFSFGDYFKDQATAWAWEFITKELELPLDRIWVSIYKEDDEAFEIWTKKVGVSPDKIVRLGKKDNFWEIGSGPCGPCSEIYFDRGVEYGCDSLTCAVGCDCDRYVEFWNLVFTQFNSDGEGNYIPLERPNIDTGMGLERLACIMQGVGNLFEVDTVAKIMEHICKIAEVKYKSCEKKDISLRVITDHVRSTTFMIGDGVTPHNEGRGYVLRRLLRRAARHGRLLGINKPFLYKVCETVIDENKCAYPDIDTNREYIVKVIKAEEERFEKTIGQGMELLTQIIDKIVSDDLDKKVMPGDLAFKLYDTFGFPIDLTREILDERSIEINQEQFDNLMKEQRERAQAAHASMGDVSWKEDTIPTEIEPTRFAGYEQTSCKAVVQAIIVEGMLVKAIEKNQIATIILDITPFYAESGGQSGDKGIIAVGTSAFEVYDCKKSSTGKFMHIGIMQSGEISQNDNVTAAIATPNRKASSRNHTACHLLQQALREVLGTHVHQSGSMVDNSICRFDFSHFNPVTSLELKKVEAIVNDMIFSSMSVIPSVMSIDDAKNIGAMALFTEKYGDEVRVVNIAERSIELCGGIHVQNTAQIGMFKIIKESSVAAGIRRIEAVTGRGVLDYIYNLQTQLDSIADSLKISANSNVSGKVSALVSEIKDKDKIIGQLTQKIANSQIQNLFSNAKEVNGIKIISAGFTGTTPETLRTLGDRAKENNSAIVALFTAVNNQKGSIFVVCGKDAVAKGANAGKIVKEITNHIGGSGGGKPDSAMGGVSDIFKIDEALAYGYQVIEKMLS